MARGGSIASPQSRIVLQASQGLGQTVMKNGQLNPVSPGPQGLGLEEIAFDNAALSFGWKVKLALVTQSEINIRFLMQVFNDSGGVVHEGFRVFSDVVSGTQVVQVLQGLLARIGQASTRH